MKETISTDLINYWYTYFRNCINTQNKAKNKI